MNAKCDIYGNRRKSFDFDWNDNFIHIFLCVFASSLFNFSQKQAFTTPPSTRKDEPLVAEANGLQT